MPCAFSTRGNQGTEWSRPWPRSTRLAPAEWSSARRRLGRRVSAPEPGAASCVSIWDATWRSGSRCRAQRGSAVTGGFDTVMAALAAGAPPGWSTRNEATREVAVQGPAPRPGSGHCPAHCVPAPPPTRVPVRVLPAECAWQPRSRHPWELGLLGGRRRERSPGVPLRCHVNEDPPTKDTHGRRGIAGSVWLFPA